MSMRRGWSAAVLLAFAGCSDISVTTSQDPRTDFSSIKTWAWFDSISNDAVDSDLPELSRRRIKDIILPASEISMVAAGLSLAEALLRTHLDLHTRFPICSVDNNPQTIEGYITFKDLVTALKMHAPTPTVNRS